ncbi:MAG: pitrilysin family protein [Bacteroidota bacterium]
MNTPLIAACAGLLALTSSTTTMHAQIDRTVRPKGGPAPRVQLPDIQKARLANGLEIRLVRDTELPELALNLIIHAGSDRDPAGRPGVASLTADVLDEGTSSRSALEIADAMEFVGAQLSVRSTFDATFVTLNTLTRHLDATLEVMADVLTDPAFPPREVERLRDQRLTALLQQKDRAATIASLAFSRIVYGDSHPYGKDPAGTEQSLGAITREDLERFYRTYYRPGNAVLIVVGDITLEDATSRLGRALGRWTGDRVPAAEAPPTPEVDARRIYLIDKPGAPQSEIRIGYPALARSTPDYFPVLAMNRILGGQFASRLNMNLRERHGYTYGARSSFQFLKHPGPFMAAAGVFAGKTDSALAEFLRELDLMHREGVTPEELDFIKKGLVGGFALSFETPAQVAGILQNIVLYNLPDDYYQTYLQNIERIGREDVRQVAGQYLDASRMAVVVVGDVASIRSGMEAMKAGPIVLCDTEGRPLP